jgi:hypothetical protein
MGVETAFFSAREVEPFLPPEVCLPRTVEEVSRRRWDLLALTREGCRLLESGVSVCCCGTLLLPGDLGYVALSRVRSERVVDYGLSSRDSLTLSSLSRGAVVCVQRMLIRPDGNIVEPGELPLTVADLPPEELLAVAGIRLLTC